MGDIRQEQFLRRFLGRVISRYGGYSMVWVEFACAIKTKYEAFAFRFEILPFFPLYVISVCVSVMVEREERKSGKVKSIDSKGGK